MPPNEKPITGHFALMYPTNYVKAADLRGKDVTVIISHCTWENLVMSGGKRDRKVTVHLKSLSGKTLEKTWVVGKTNLRGIAQATGENDIANWSGKRVTIYPTTCRGAKGETVECIRVRPRVGASAEEPTPDMMATPDPRPAFLDEVEGEGAA